VLGCTLPPFPPPRPRPALPPRGRPALAARQSSSVWCVREGRTEEKKGKRLIYFITHKFID
jgi:hypothetical protein